MVVLGNLFVIYAVVESASAHRYFDRPAKRKGDIEHFQGVFDSSTLQLLWNADHPARYNDV